MLDHDITIVCSSNPKIFGNKTHIQIYDENGRAPDDFYFYVLEQDRQTLIEILKRAGYTNIEEETNVEN